jgi:hypothetical protein
VPVVKNKGYYQRVNIKIKTYKNKTGSELAACFFVYYPASVGVWQEK